MKKKLLLVFAAVAIVCSVGATTKIANEVPPTPTKAGKVANEVPPTPTFIKLLANEVPPTPTSPRA